jgi:glucose/arabinose dehydrogenase
MRFISFVIAALTIGFSNIASAEYVTETVAENLRHPWSMAFLPDGSALVTEREGRLRLIDANGNLREAPIDGLPDIWVKGQAGLFEIKLSPDFEQSRQVYLTYACGSRRAHTTCLARARYGERGLEATEEIFRATANRDSSVHFGGRLLFLKDETLILTLGDAFDLREEAQNRHNHLGSAVRLNLDGSVPDDNPFIGEADVLPETFAYGLRNVQGIVYDEANDRIVAVDHGPRGGDKLLVLEAGNNYGWPLITEGLDYSFARITPYKALPGLSEAMLIWTPSIAPGGLALYEGDAFPQWRGDFMVAALAAKKVQRVRVSGSEVVEQEPLFEELGVRIRQVYSGPDGALYLLSDEEDGAVIRVTAVERQNLQQP